jgi:hypothetical protein
MKRRGARSQFQERGNNTFANGAGAGAPGQFYGSYGFPPHMPSTQHAQFYSGGYFGQGFGGGPLGNGLYGDFPALQIPPAPAAPAPAPAPAPALTPAPAPAPTPPTTLYQVGDSGTLLLPEPAYPSVSAWLAHCATMAARSNKGIDFTALAHLFATNGFHSLDQIDGSLITPMQLREWLNIDLGTGVRILQYAKADLDAINAGTQHFNSFHTSDGAVETSNTDYIPEMITQGESY